MYAYTKSSSLSTPRPQRFEDSARWGASWAAAHPKNETANPPTATPRRVYSGQYLSKNKLGARARAQLAVDLLNGTAEITKLTTKQAAKLCRVSVVYVDSARKAPEQLVEALAEASPEALHGLARKLGEEKLWKLLGLVVE